MATAPPRPITGTVGSRVRLIFGDDGDEWLLLLDEDDGDTEWQSHYWSSIPNAVAKQLNNCSSKGRYVTEIDFGSTGTWYMHGTKRDGTCGHHWWGGTGASADIKEAEGRVKLSFGSEKCTYTDDEEETYVVLEGRNGFSFSSNIDGDLLERMKRLNKRNKTIDFIRLFDDGAYFISDDEGTEWKGISEHCSKELKEGGAVEDLAVAKDGSWVIIRPNHYVCSVDVDTTLQEHLNRFFREQAERNKRRARKIRKHHERVEREAREEMERIEREAREEMKRIEREAREKKIMDEIREIQQQETNLREQEACLRTRKRSLEASIEQLPPAQRVRLKVDLTQTSVSSSTSSEATMKVECIVCHDSEAVRAVIPCGHHCLCDDCADTIVSSSDDAQLCPLCRGRIERTLTIFRP